MDVEDSTRGRFSHIKDHFYWFPLTVGDLFNIPRWGYNTGKELTSLTVRYLSIGYLCQQASFTKILKAAAKTAGYALLILCKPIEALLSIIGGPRVMRWSHRFLYEPALQREAKAFEEKLQEINRSHNENQDETEAVHQALQAQLKELKTSYPLVFQFPTCLYQEAVHGWTIYHQLEGEKNAFGVGIGLKAQFNQYKAVLDDPEKASPQQVRQALDFIERNGESLRLSEITIPEDKRQHLWIICRLAEWEEKTKELPDDITTAVADVTAAQQALGKIEAQIQQAIRWCVDLKKFEHFLPRLVRIHHIVAT